MKTTVFYKHNHSGNRITGSKSWWYTCTKYNPKKKESYVLGEFAHVVYKDGTSETKRIV